MLGGSQHIMMPWNFFVVANFY